MCNRIAIGQYFIAAYLWHDMGFKIIIYTDDDTVQRLISAP